MDKKNILYLAKPSYGGWVSMTAHLSKVKSYPIHKITNRHEHFVRKFGYGASYQNICRDHIKTLDNIIITAVDKHYYDILPLIPDGSEIVIHDPTEVKNIDILEHLIRFKVIVIRETMKEYLKEKFNLESEFRFHPFYCFHRDEIGSKDKNVSISRIDFDKNINILCDTNDLLSPQDRIDIYGACNDMYVYHKLKDTNFDVYYKGRFDKDLQAISDILMPAKFCIDMSTIKHDGGGSQYTFLEAIYFNTILILNSKWTDNKNNIWIDGENCFIARDSHELKQILETEYEEEYLDEIRANSYNMLIPFIMAEGW